jgi:hypothetical protein
MAAAKEALNDVDLVQEVFTYLGLIEFGQCASVCYVWALAAKGLSQKFETVENGELCVPNTAELPISGFNPSSCGSSSKAFSSWREKAGRLNYPTYVLPLEDGNILVSDTRNHRLQLLSATGEPRSTCGRCASRPPPSAREYEADSSRA